MAEFINTIDILGDDAVIDSIIERTITEFKDDVITSIGGTAFRKCYELTVVDVPKVTTIEGEAMRQCTALTALILRGETVCVLSNSNALSQSAIANGTGYIYVPRSLVDSYKSQTNFSTYANRIRAIEDYPEITGG
jgi:hypothetical protein